MHTVWREGDATTIAGPFILPVPDSPHVHWYFSQGDDNLTLCRVRWRFLSRAERKLLDSFMGSWEPSDYDYPWYSCRPYKVIDYTGTLTLVGGWDETLMAYRRLDYVVLDRGTTQRIIPAGLAVRKAA